MSRGEFYKYWREIHGPIGAHIPGVRRFVQSHSIPVPGDAHQPDYDGMVELWFDDVAALLTARKTPQWEASTRDETNFIDHRKTAYFVTEGHGLV